MAFFRKPPKWHHHWPMCSHMEGLYHKVPGKAFSKEASEVVQWIAENAGVDTDTADLIRESARQAKVIVYNEATAQWSGDWRSALTMYKGATSKEETPTQAPARRALPYVPDPDFKAKMMASFEAQK